MSNMSETPEANAVLDAAKNGVANTLAEGDAEAKPGFFAKLKEKFSGPKPQEGEDGKPEGEGAGRAPEPSKAASDAAEDIRDEFEELLNKMTAELDKDGFDPDDLMKALKALSKKVEGLSAKGEEAKKSAEEIKRAHVSATAQQIQKTASSVAKKMSELVGDEVPFEAVLEAWIDMRPAVEKRYSDLDAISTDAFEFAFKRLYADEIAEASKHKAKSSPTLSKSSAPVAGAKSLEQRVLEAYRSTK